MNNTYRTRVLGLSNVHFSFQSYNAFLLLISVSAADVHKSIVIKFDASFLITSVAGSTIECITALSVGMAADDVISNGSWFLADFSSTAVSFSISL